MHTLFLIHTHVTRIKDKEVRDDEFERDQHDCTWEGLEEGKGKEK